MCASTARVRVAALARRPRRRRPLPRRDRGEARHRVDARRRRRRPALRASPLRSAPGRRTARRGTAAGSCSATSTIRARGPREAETYYQWREGDSFAFAFPSAPVGTAARAVHGPSRRGIRGAQRDPEGYWRRKLDEHPGLRARIAGATPRRTRKIRSTGETPAFFRASSGPGWALAGDAGHFKDPVTGQGMRDAMWMGRTLAEKVLPVLDDPLAVDRATRVWEAERDRALPAGVSLRQHGHEASSARHRSSAS